MCFIPGLVWRPGWRLFGMFHLGQDRTHPDIAEHFQQNLLQRAETTDEDPSLGPELHGWRKEPAEGGDCAREKPGQDREVPDGGKGGMQTFKGR